MYVTIRWLLLLTLTTCISVTTPEKQGSLEQFRTILKSPEKLNHMTSIQSHGYELQQFSFVTCNKTAPLQGSITVSPDPVKIPGNVTVTFQGYAGVAVTSPTKTILKVEKKFVIWVEIPCVENYGSCTYDDGCSVIPFKAGQPCPAPLDKYNIPCTCPFREGNYNLPQSEIAVPDMGLPGWATEGEYKVNAKLYDSHNNQLACFDVAFTLAAPAV